jgi:heme-degrading monooxygenase HmoA
MHARVTKVQAEPGRIDEVVARLEEEDVPEFKKLAGFKGFTLLVDRQSGAVIGTSYWASREDMDASEEAVTGARERAAERGGGSQPTVERYEVAVDTEA